MGDGGWLVCLGDCTPTAVYYVPCTSYDSVQPIGNHRNTLFLFLCPTEGGFILNFRSKHSHATTKFLFPAVFFPIHTCRVAFLFVFRSFLRGLGVRFSHLKGRIALLYTADMVVLHSRKICNKGSVCRGRRNYTLVIVSSFTPLLWNNV